MAAVKKWGFTQALETLQNLDEASRLRILSDIQKTDPGLAKQLQDDLFQFSDLQFMLASDFKVIWWEIPRQVWSLALRKAPSSVLFMLKKNMSTRAFSELQESIKNLGPQPLSKVMSAQDEICSAVRKLAAEGRMALPGSKKNDPMV